VTIALRYLHGGRAAGCAGGRFSRFAGRAGQRGGSLYRSCAGVNTAAGWRQPLVPEACEATGMNEASIRRIAELLRERNIIDEEIAVITHRPMTSGHLGEWIASQVFNIELEQSAAAAAIDGHFRTGPLQGRTVNAKWYLKREGLLDTSESDQLDYYLVLTGPVAAAATSWGATRPWCIEAVFLFDARQLRAEQTHRGVKRGVASSVLKRQWLVAEIYPSASNPLLPSAMSRPNCLHSSGPDDKRDTHRQRHEHRNAACVKSGRVLRRLLVLCLAFKRVVPGSVDRA